MKKTEFPDPSAFLPGKVVITGGPGFGKTSIIECLGSLGFRSVEEISRHIIREQLEKDGEILPWKNLETFSRIVMEHRIKQWDETPENTLSFFDRGIPDVVAYMALDNLEMPESYARHLMEKSYYPLVFLTPPWQEIFQNDSERKETLKQAEEAHEMIGVTYRQLGYETVEIPKMNIMDRALFILRKLKNFH